MLGAIRKILILSGLCLLAAACASAPRDDLILPSGGAYPDTRPQDPGVHLECVPFARAQSGIDIHGDAYTWWDQAAGRYARFYIPEDGAVMVLDGYAGPRRAHLAVVRAILSPRIIHVDHANWLDRGQVHLDDPVMDVSNDNDWSLVRVFNLATGNWGTKVYHVRGFIGTEPPDDRGGPAIAASSN